jgi:hypothetical protein
MSAPNATISIFNKRKADTMSANVYTIESLLVGTLYYSRTLTGEIISAEKHPACIHYADAEAYLVEVRKPTGGYAYRTVAVNN